MISKRLLDGSRTFRVHKDTFWLENVPSTFHCCMNEEFKDVVKKFSFIYTDDILIYSSNSFLVIKCF